MSNEYISSLLETSLFNFQQTAKRLELNDSLILRLSEPKELIEITLNPRLPCGKVMHLKAFICHHNDALGPAKGGIRMIKGVSSADITGLAMEMTWKTALIGVPFGGGKSGIYCDTKTVSVDDKEAIIRSFTRAAHRHIGPEMYIPAPDMGTNQEDMGHIRDCISYSEGTSITGGCYVTGKPVILGGIEGRREATGHGVVYSTLEACKTLGIDIAGSKVVIQGFGNVASVAAEAIEKAGAKVIAVSDVVGGIINEQGLDVTSLLSHYNETGSFKGFPNVREISNDDVLTCDCDILIPAATQSQITPLNANSIKAKIIAEGANSPVTPDADEILNEMGVFVIPDILCNAGGVFVSYLEYTQETQREQMTIEQVQRRLRERMQNRFGEVYKYSMKNSLSMRDAAMNLAVQRVVDATHARGLLP